MNVSYQQEPDLDPAEWIDVMERSTLDRRRPPADPERSRQLLRNSDVIITARRDGKLVGVSRAITDFLYCTYLADLAVDVNCQRQGIGKELIRQTRLAAGENNLLVLLAAPAAQTYYPHVGFTQHQSCWVIPRPTVPASPTQET